MKATALRAPHAEGADGESYAANSVSRRAVFAGLIAAAAIGKAEAAPVVRGSNRIENALAELASAMQERYGGETWKVRFDHEAQLVLVMSG